MKFTKKEIDELRFLTTINNHLEARLFIAKKLDNQALIKTVEALIGLHDSPYIDYKLIHKIRFNFEENLYIQITKNIENAEEVIASL